MTETKENTPQNTDEKNMENLINSVIEKGYSPETAKSLRKNECQRDAMLNITNLSNEKKVSETTENTPQDSEEKKIVETTENTPQYSEEKDTTETKENTPQDSEEKDTTETKENTPQDSEEKDTTEPAENTPQDTEEKRMLKFINSIVEKGYSPETAETLWENRCQREAILNDPDLSDEEKRNAIRETRQNDLEVMLEDQKEGQKIKYAFRLYNKTQKMVEAIQNAKTEEERQQKTEEYDKFVEENKEWAKDNKEIMRIVREDIRNKKTPPKDNSYSIEKDNTKDDKKFAMPEQTETKTIKLSKDETRQKIEANKEKTFSSKRKKNTVKLTPTYDNIDENKTPIISLYDIKNKKLRA